MRTVVHERFYNDLKNSGHSVTNERKIIFEILEQFSPISISDIESKLKNRLNRSTIYRNIELFEKLGFIKRIYIGWKYKIELSEKYSPHHHHITCVNCGSVTAVESFDLIEDAISELTKLYNFEQSSHQLEIQGLCQNCC